MSLMVKAMQVKVGNPTRKLVLLKLADNANDKGMCFPSYQNIAEQCEISKRCAINHIEDLIKMGLVTKKHRRNQDGSSSNLYQLHLDQGSENSAPPSENSALGSEYRSLGVVNNLHPPSENSAPITSQLTSHIEPVNNITQSPDGDRKKTTKGQTLDLLAEYGITGELAEEFIAHRKSKRARISTFALKAFEREARKAGISIQRAVEISIEKNWQGFEASWIGFAEKTVSNGLPPVDYSAVVEAYNAVVSESGVDLPLVVDTENLSDDRKKQIHELAKIFHKRFGDYSANAFANYFRDFVAQISARTDKFYSGGLSGNGWKADFGYVMQEKTLDKTVENSL